MKRIVKSLVLIAIFAVVILADIPRPKTPIPNPAPKGNEVEMYVGVTNEYSEPTLIIKKSSAKLLRAALDEAENVESNSAAVETTKSSSFASTQTLIGGTFLTLAFIFGGVRLARSKPSKTVISLFLIGILATGTVLVFANIAPPRIFGINKNMLSEEFQSRSGAYARGKVRIKIVNDSNPVSDDIKLLIPKNPENTLLPRDEE